MLAHEPPHREDAGSAVAAGAGGPAHLRQGARARLHGDRDRRVVDDVALADDHGTPVTGSAVRTDRWKVRLT